MRAHTLLLSALALCPALPAAAQAREDAAALYIRAAGNGFDVQSTAESTLEFRPFPPYPPEWHQLAKAAREANRDRLALARIARTQAPAAKWPTGHDQSYLNPVRGLATSRVLEPPKPSGLPF